MKKNITTYLLLVLTATLLVACGAPTNQPLPTNTPPAPTAALSESATPQAMTATVIATAPGSTAEPSTSVTPAATEVIDGPETPVPGETTTPADDGAGVGTDVVGSNLFKFILGEADAPEGLTVAPCDWDAPMLCVLEGSEVVGQVELFMSHLETLPDFQRTLESEGLTPGSIDYRNGEQTAGIVAALRTFVEDYHKSFEEDRRLTYGDTATYTRLETQDASIADIPGLRYGFVVNDKANKVLERWISFTAFDGSILYILTPHYDPRTHTSFRSDEEVQSFEPYMRDIAANLKLPLPVLETDVKQVVTLASVPMFRYYGNGSNPVAEVPAGQTLDVTGRSPDDRAWRVTCPGELTGECWVSAHPKLTQPVTP
ncbi:MAG: hypothetical protein M3437_09275 [Chloroflexota bacterium]|nr:hypothetical protein [Chloroflexota bacterium]MDQ5867823.1 hypothetical protein [Chloroflexota bacterium]